MIYSSRVSDPHWFNADPDPAFFSNCSSGFRIRIQGLMTENWKKLQLKKKLIFFLGSKTTIYLSLGLHKGGQSYRRSLQPSKKNIQHYKTWKLSTFFIFLWVIFPLLDPDPDPATQINADPCGSGSETLYSRQCFGSWYVFNLISGSGFGIRIQEGKNDLQK
jgi:hypothetical protein